MGFTDLTAFGCEDIRAPTLDALAMRGIRFTNFHGHIRCELSRATLTSGTTNHEAMFGTRRRTCIAGKVTQSSKERVIHRVSDEPSFDVAHDEQCPFLVYAADSMIRAVGTRFAWSPIRSTSR